MYVKLGSHAVPWGEKESVLGEITIKNKFKKIIMACTATWMQLEIILLSGVS